jgi:hypothetical protein
MELMMALDSEKVGSNLLPYALSDVVLVSERAQSENVCLTRPTSHGKYKIRRSMRTTDFPGQQGTPDDICFLGQTADDFLWLRRCGGLFRFYCSRIFLIRR